jgi:hypothetical protein
MHRHDDAGEERMQQEETLEIPDSEHALTQTGKHVVVAGACNRHFCQPGCSFTSQARPV